MTRGKSDCELKDQVLEAPLAMVVGYPLGARHELRAARLNSALNRQSAELDTGKPERGSGVNPKNSPKKLVEVLISRLHQNSSANFPVDVKASPRSPVSQSYIFFISFLLLLRPTSRPRSASSLLHHRDLIVGLA
jgi:hypothetical protein